MSKNTARESHIHGRAWRSMHGGYFSDPETAKALLARLNSAARDSAPSTVADLGGGTGFILDALRRKKSFRTARLVNIDVSARQLEQCRLPGLECLSCPAEKLTRGKLLPAGTRGPLMLTMRSLLHYFGGRQEQKAFLQKARTLTRKGEYFVHQSACFIREEDAALMNKTYRLMRVNKAYLTRERLSAMLEECGWKTEKILRAPALNFTSGEMKRRYRLSARAMSRIRAIACEKACVRPWRTGFSGRLEYAIFVCRAA